MQQKSDEERERIDAFYYNREIGKNGKRKRGISYKPTIKVLNTLLKEEPENFYADDQGRLYGVVEDEDNPIYMDLSSKGEIDGQNSKLFFIWLPDLMRGVFAKKKKREVGSLSNLSESEVLLFPSDNESIDLKRYNDYDSDPVMTISVRYYPEKIGSRSRTSFALCDVSN